MINSLEALVVTGPSDPTGNSGHTFNQDISKASVFMFKVKCLNAQGIISCSRSSSSQNAQGLAQVKSNRQIESSNLIVVDGRIRTYIGKATDLQSVS